MDGDDSMEMEIDETVPDTQIIENKRNSDDFIALMEEISKTTDPKATVSSNTDPVSDTTKSVNLNNEIELKKKLGNETVHNDDDIVCIDDDGKNMQSIKDNQKLKEDINECEVIDLVKTQNGSVNSKCINYMCKSGINFQTAPLFCLTFYRVKSAENKKQEVCQACSEIALKHFDDLADSLLHEDTLFQHNIPVRNDLVEIDDSDSENELNEDDEEPLSEFNIQFLRESLEKCLYESIDKHKLKQQTSESIRHLKEQGETVKEQFMEIDKEVHDIRKTLDAIHRATYAEFKVANESLPPIDIMSEFYTESNKMISIADQLYDSESEKRSLRKTKPISYVELEDSAGSNSPIVESRMAESKESIEFIQSLPAPPDLPVKGSITKPPLITGEFYYAVRLAVMGSWIKVRLSQILKPGSIVNGQPTSQTMYCVIMENKTTKYPTNRLVSGKEIAYAYPSSVLLDVGTRVIAIFYETFSTGEKKKFNKEAFYPGIVAEPCSYSNRYRYLIFFDDGYAQYVDYKFVHLIFESSKEVWEDMHIDSRPFIKKYLESYPDRPMVKLRKDQTVRTEYNGKWWLTTVMNIDCSLVQMFFDASSRIEWIYRGSTRLNPMFKEEQAASNRNNKSRIHRQFNETDPYVQYTRESERSVDSVQENEVVRAVARKSTSTPVIRSNKVQTVPFLPPINSLNSFSTPTPPLSKVCYFTPRKQVNTKSIYEVHQCSPKCKKFISYDITKLKGYNPLSKPLLCGWNRITYRYRNRKEINYKAPCGRFVRNMSELHKYLRITQSEMTVDLFDFDSWVHCLAEFILERNSTINKDMSNGLETVTIPIVNYVDNDLNSFCNYSIKREPMEGVHLNLDPEFLCGCDCEDDCQDKQKCRCWQLTLEGLKYLPKNTDPELVGYTYRRLPEPVITGIYECNSRCKCAKTCLNRVVQNPLQLKLQVFKTHNRGWGIRCLNDIPQGAFICIYAGSILTEQMANEGGKNYGDEYLAELDYIEVVEKMKEDYEEDVIEQESDKSNKHREGSEAEEEEIEDLSEEGRPKKRLEEDDMDFLPTSHVPKGKDSSYKKRLRKRDADGKSDEKGKLDEDECVTISDDEDVFHEPSSFNPKNDLDDSRSTKYKSVREMFAEDECIYVMDAKVTGNIGRFLNHSCSPNVFVQNVFVDTHDVRFPWVAFFALSYIRAGTELTWNYNYDVGSVPGKILYCHCSSQDCRGRLL